MSIFEQWNQDLILPQFTKNIYIVKNLRKVIMIIIYSFLNKG
jgi:hypothetical protein